MILETFEKHEGRYGYRRIHAELKAQGYFINHKKVQRLMQELNLKCEKFVRKSRYKSYKGTVGKVAKNRLNRRFSTPHALQKIVTDVTEFKCTDNEKLYLSPLMDLYNGEIIGFSISKGPTLEFVMASLNQALPVLQKGANYRITIHSDQGWHYQMKQYRHALQSRGIVQSMSRKGNCYDNSVMENFFGHLKSELLYLQEFKSMEHFKAELIDYIDYYNHRRIKARLKGLPPALHRQQALLAA